MEEKYKKLAANLILLSAGVATVSNAAFVYSNAGACQADTSVAGNTSPLSSTNTIRTAHMNELRDAIEKMYTNFGTGSHAWTNTVGAMGSTVSVNTSSVVRSAHINELRVAINKMRTNIQRCTCDAQCDCDGQCTCECNANGCWMGCNDHARNYSTHQTKTPLLGNYSWSNDTGTNDTGTGSRVSTNMTVSANTINEIRLLVDQINTNQGTKPSDYYYGINQVIP